MGVNIDESRRKHQAASVNLSTGGVLKPRSKRDNLTIAKRDVKNLSLGSAAITTSVLQLRGDTYCR